MLKICITRDVAITYTATKITLGKALMRDEPFYSSIEGTSFTYGVLHYFYIQFYYINNNFYALILFCL